MIVYGKQVFFYIVKKHPELVEEIYLAKEIEPKLFESIRRLGKKVIRVDAKKAQALAQGGNHQGFLLKVRPFEFLALEACKAHDFLVLLFGVTDVGNIGSIIRTAYSLGVGAVVICGIKSISLEGVARTSSGALFDMPCALAPNALDLLNELKQAGFVLYGATMQGEDIDSVAGAQKRALVLGSEGEGIPKRVLAKLDKKVAIPMERDFDSLGVSAAAAILIERMRRWRR